MNLNRTATLLVVGGVLAAWLANAMTPVGRVPMPSAAPAQRRVDARGEDLAKEIARLHDRLRPDATPSAPGRNLFEFKRAPAAAVAPRPVEVPPAVVAPPVQAPLTLAGIAEDAGPDGIVRTAIISGSAQLFLVKQGDSVAPRYKVTKITADGVDLEDATDGSLRHLQLK